MVNGTVQEEWRDVVRNGRRQTYKCVHGVVFNCSRIIVKSRALLNVFMISGSLVVLNLIICKQHRTDKCCTPKNRSNNVIIVQRSYVGGNYVI